MPETMQIVQPDGTIYFGEHSITFGDGTLTEAGKFAGKHTWRDWYLIPTGRPTISQAGASTSFVDIPGRKLGPVDLSEYLTGGMIYTARQGSLSFYVDNLHADWETIRYRIVKYLHGKKMKMCLDDDPNWVYGGRFTMNEWRSDPWRSSVVIDYVLCPYKFPITYSGLYEWDPFNFDTDQTDMAREGRL